MSQIWIRRLIYELTRQPIVVDVADRVKYLKVTYQTGVIERYWYGCGEPRQGDIVLTMANSKINKPLKPVRQFEADLLSQNNDYDHHWSISRKTIKTASLLDKFLLANRLALVLTKVGYNGKHHPTTLATCWDQLQKVNKLQCFNNSIFSVKALPTSLAWLARPLVEHFFDLSFEGHISFKEAFRRPRLLYTALRSLLLAQRARFTTANFYRTLSNKRVGPRLTHPLLYVSILAKMNIKGAVLDLHPDYGSKALACAILGLPYRTYQNGHFDHALANGFGNYIGLKHARYQEGEPIDVVIADNNFKAVDYESALAEAASAKCLISYVPVHRYAEVEQQYKPKLSIKLMRRPAAADYILLW